MTTTILTTGLACLIAAIVGGGLKAFGIEIPVLRSGKRQLTLGAFGLILVLVSTLSRQYSKHPEEGSSRPTAADVVDRESSPSPAQKVALLSELHQNEKTIQDLQNGLTEHAAQISAQEVRIDEQERRLNRGEGSSEERTDAQKAIDDARAAIDKARVVDAKARENIQALNERNHQIQEALAGH